MTTLISHPDHSLYSNAFGFLRQPLNFDPLASNADVIITGLPFDLATTGRSGSRMGPGAIRQSSINLAWEHPRWPWHFSLTKHLNIQDAGDLIFDCGDAEQFCQRLQTYAEDLLKTGKTMLCLGGDHFVTLPLLRAHFQTHGKMALIHFDAHTDTYSQGGKFDHGTMFYHAPKEGLIDTDHSIQIGIRTDYARKNYPFEVIDAGLANDLPAQEIAARIINRVSDLPIYLTFDIDCLDPAFAPGTGTPVCGGLTTDKILKILRELKDLNIVGMDVVEVAPAYDHAELTSLAAATVATELLHLLAWKKQQR